MNDVSSMVILSLAPLERSRMALSYDWSVVICSLIDPPFVHKVMSSAYIVNGRSLITSRASPNLPGVRATGHKAMTC